MKAKSIVAGVLLAFVLASVGALVVKESSKRGEPAGRETATEGQDAGETTGHKVIAYYFHGNFRCQTCRKLEAYACEAVETGFKEEMKAVKLEWRVVNVEEPGNEHFVEDYGLVTRSVVLVDMEAEEEVDWKNLERIWDLVGNKGEFMAYVQEEIRAYLGDD